MTGAGHGEDQIRADRQEDGLCPPVRKRERLRQEELFQVRDEDRGKEEA